MFTWYFITWNFVSVKMTDMKSIPALTLRLFISFRVDYVHMKSSCRFEISFRSKRPIWNPYGFEFHFASIHVNTSKELTEQRSEIFNRNEISYQFEFISPLTWTFSKYNYTVWSVWKLFEVGCLYQHIVLALYRMNRNGKLLKFCVSW